MFQCIRYSASVCLLCYFGHFPVQPAGPAVDANVPVILVLLREIDQRCIASELSCACLGQLIHIRSGHGSAGLRVHAPHFADLN